MVVWESRHEGQISIFGQVYDSQGNPRTGQFRISDYSVDERVRPAVGMDGAGNFVVAWQGWGNDTYGWGINAQRFSANGTPLGGRFVVNSYQAGYQSSAAVAMRPSGEFVIIWQDEMNGGAHVRSTLRRLRESSRRPVPGELAPGKRYLVWSRRHGCRG